jgi:hypothetical protein
MPFAWWTISPPSTRRSPTRGCTGSRWRPVAVETLAARSPLTDHQLPDALRKLKRICASRGPRPIRRVGGCVSGSVSTATLYGGPVARSSAASRWAASEFGDLCRGGTESFPNGNRFACRTYGTTDASLSHDPRVRQKTPLYVVDVPNHPARCGDELGAGPESRPRDHIRLPIPWNRV